MPTAENRPPMPSQKVKEIKLRMANLSALLSAISPPRGGQEMNEFKEYWSEYKALRRKLEAANAGQTGTQSTAEPSKESA
ncbi:hypothetical protein VTI74DRAFT_7241 [Chaetomium olivicolor]